MKCEDVLLELDTFARGESTHQLEVDAHLVSCSSCLEQLQFVRQLLGAYSCLQSASGSKEPASVETVDEVMMAIGIGSIPEVVTSPHLWSRRVAVVAALLFVGLTLFLLLRGPVRNAPFEDDRDRFRSSLARVENTEPESMVARDASPPITEMTHISRIPEIPEIPGTFPGTFVTTRWAGRPHVTWVPRISGGVGHCPSERGDHLSMVTDTEETTGFYRVAGRPSAVHKGTYLGVLERTLEGTSCEDILVGLGGLPAFADTTAETLPPSGGEPFPISGTTVVWNQMDHGLGAHMLAFSGP